MAPNIHGNSDSMSDIKQQMAAQQRFNKHEIAYSKLTPQQQQRRDHIEEIEYGLTQHPLALYPHLEESMPPEVSISNIAAISKTRKNDSGKYLSFQNISHSVKYFS